MASPGAPIGLAAPRGVGGTQPRGLGPVGRRSWWRAAGGRAGQEAWGGPGAATSFASLIRRWGRLLAPLGGATTATRFGYAGYTAEGLG